MSDEDGSKPLNQSEPVIMTFAMSLEEWARVSASLKMLVGMAEEVAKSRGEEPPEGIQTIIATATQFSRMVFDEVGRLSK